MREGGKARAHQTQRVLHPIASQPASALAVASSGRELATGWPLSHPWPEHSQQCSASIPNGGGARPLSSAPPRRDSPCLAGPAAVPFERQALFSAELAVSGSAAPPRRPLAAMAWPISRPVFTWRRCVPSCLIRSHRAGCCLRFGGKRPANHRLATATKSCVGRSSTDV